MDFQHDRFSSEEEDGIQFFIHKHDWNLINPNLPYPEEEMKTAKRLEEPEYQKWLQDWKIAAEEEEKERQMYLAMPQNEFKAHCVLTIRKMSNSRQRIDAGELDSWLKVMGLSREDFK